MLVDFFFFLLCWPKLTKLFFFFLKHTCAVPSGQLLARLTYNLSTVLLAARSTLSQEYTHDGINPAIYMYSSTDSTHAHLPATANQYVFLQTGCQMWKLIVLQCSLLVSSNTQLVSLCHSLSCSSDIVLLTQLLDGTKVRHKVANCFQLQ